MKQIHILIPALLTALSALTTLTALSAQAGQLYQWKDAQGRVFYSDQQPPPSVKNASQKNFKGSFIEGGESYAMKRAREKSPVILYITACGATCDQAKQLLDQRSIPYANKNPWASDEDRAALKKLTGKTHVPVLIIGSAKLEGYDATQWNASLDLAGYPKAGDTTKKAALTQNPASPPKTPEDNTPEVPVPASPPR